MALWKTLLQNCIKASRQRISWDIGIFWNRQALKIFLYFIPKGEYKYKGKYSLALRPYLLL